MAYSLLTWIVWEMKLHFYGIVTTVELFMFTI